MTAYQELYSSTQPVPPSLDEGREIASSRHQGLTTKEALLKLQNDMEQEIVRMKTNLGKRKFLSCLKESVSFKSELSKIRWPSVLFMTAQAIAHFIVAFILDIDDLATGWIGCQGFILTFLLLINLAVNFWDTELRFKELLIKSEQILNLIKECSQNKHLLKHWRQYNWTSANAKTLFIPKSPCLHTTLTYRDESCLNLPDHLLVTGDIIRLYPGDRAPGECTSFGRLQALDANGGNDKQIFLKENQIFHDTNLDEQYKVLEHYESTLDTTIDTPKIDNEKKNISLQFSHAKLKKAKRGKDFLMLNTPYIKSLRVSLQRSHKRPVNSVEKECFIISRKYFETFVVPCVFLLSTIVTAIHYGYLDLMDSDQKIKTISIAYLLLRPSLTIMPFLPWMFPCFWLIVNAYGSARIICCGEAKRQKSDPHSDGRETSSSDDHENDYSPTWSNNRTSMNNQTAGANIKFTENLLATPTAAGSSENKHSDENELNELRINIKFTTILRVFLDLVQGKGGHVWRSSSLLQVLGCLTSLCCIDKVGILSWSNPTPEKVFVLTKNETNEPNWNHIESNEVNQSDDNVSQIKLEEGTSNAKESRLNDISVNHSNMMTTPHDDQVSTNNISMQFRQTSSFTSECRPEVLDVSQIMNCYRLTNLETTMTQLQGNLQFDDLNWRKYINNLKPLGLGIMMNNCCEKSFGDYFRFYKHISYESILRCNLTPVVKRRCLCNLARIIGFSKEAVQNYKYINQTGFYKLVDPLTINKGRLVRSLENTNRLKLPFPNMICNIHQDVTTGGYQVFSQGTADIILGACVEYWDGQELVQLNDSAKKKIMDFYHRTSLTSYCSAFSYTPLLKTHDISNRYIELPPKNSTFARHLRQLENENQDKLLFHQCIKLPSQQTNRPYESHLSSQDNFTFNHSFDDTSSGFKGSSRLITRRHLSAGSLNGQSTESLRTSLDESVKEASKRKKKARRLNDALDELTDQVFVGMVAMQYQACPDFVALIEQLEHACIRFVHFSKENELRSRVFSEKMGLESGWNCHVSLQSDEDLDLAEKKIASNLMKSQIRDDQTEHKLDSEISVKLSAFLPSNRVLNVLNGAPTDWEKSINQAGDEPRSDNCDTTNDSITSDEYSYYSWRSLPSLVMKISSKLSKHSRPNQMTTTPSHAQKQDKPDIRLGLMKDESLGEVVQEKVIEDTGTDEFEDYNEEEPIKREDGFESLAYDMSNRAKLPKGIENIRPHLETIDNVPLQVSLFTDCTPELTHEMIKIMQEYGEIVCVIGSSASRMNTPVFLQANASIAIEPLAPQCCTKNAARAQRSIERKRRKNLNKNKKHQDKVKSSKNLKKSTNNENEYTVINMNPTRLNNPRDRLGIGPAEPAKVLRTKQLAVSSSSSSSSSSLSSSSSSSSSSASSSRSSSPCSSSVVNSEEDFDPKELSDDEDIMLNKGIAATDSMSKLDEKSIKLLKELPAPNSLAAKLASLPCCYSYNRKDPVNLYGLIMEARHFTFKMKNTFVCMICFALSISSAQFLASILFLPPMLSAGLTIWLTVVVVPLQSFSLMSTTIDTQVMKIAVGKNLQLKPENITFFVICYLIKFIPSIIVVVLSFGLIIAHSCKLTGFGSSSLGPCWMFTYVQHGNATSSNTGDEDLLWSSHLLTAQVCAAFLLVLYFVVISAGFVQRSHLMWERSPTRNHFWVFISMALIVVQFVYSQLVLEINLSSSKNAYEFLASLPIYIWAISFAWPILLTAVNLLVKRAEIKATIRQQRRARFDFNTKLGMNSPF